MTIGRSISEKTKGLISLSRSGSGLKTIILVLLNLLVVPKIKNAGESLFTFAFEELENNLHPALLRRLFQYLENYVVNKKATIFLTTHSSIALDFFAYLIMPRLSACSTMASPPTRKPSTHILILSR